MTGKLTAGLGWARTRVFDMFDVLRLLLLAALVLYVNGAGAQVVFTSPAISATSGTAGTNGAFTVIFSGFARASSNYDAVNEVVVAEGASILSSVSYGVSYDPKTETPVNSTRAISNSVALAPGVHTLRLIAYTESGAQQASQDFIVTVASNTPVNGATLVSHNVPATMYAGRQYPITVTMRNSGTRTWTTAAPYPYGLGSQNPDNNATWGLQRVWLPAPVAPGASVTLNFTITAPGTPSTYSFQWGMLEEQQQRFGDVVNQVVAVVTAPPIDNAEVESQNVPATMIAGQSYAVSVTMKNTGNTTWVVGGTQPYKLGSQNPQDNTIWNGGRVALSAPVAPGASQKFSFTVTAPAAPKLYDMRWQMVKDGGGGWFGTTSSAKVTVSESLPTVTLTSPANGARFSASGTSASVSLTGSAAGTSGATITRLEFFDGSTSLGSVATTTISLSKSLTAGQHVIELRATDSRGKTGSAFSTIMIVGAAPTAVLTAPANDSIHVAASGTTASVAVLGTTNSTQVAKIELLDGGTPIHTQTNMPFGVTFAFSPGKHALQLRVTDTAGQVGTSAISNISVYAKVTGDGAGFVSQNMPGTARVGSPTKFTVSMVNTGTTTWSEAERYRLGSQNPRDNRTWGGRAYLTGSVAPGQIGTFTYTTTAPQKAGSYNFQWQMVHEGDKWFGDKTDNLAIVVATGAGPTASLTGTPTNIRVAGAATAAVTLVGNGNRSGGVVKTLELFQANALGAYLSAPIKTVTGATASLAMTAPLSLGAGIHQFKLRSTDSAGLQTESPPVFINITNSALLGTIGGVRTNAAGNAQLYGWTCQPGSITPLSYKVLLDAPSLDAGGTELTTGVANVTTELDNTNVQSQCSTPGVGHHFVVELTPHIAPYAGRRLYVWAETAGKTATVSLPCADNNCTMPGTTRVGITTPTANATFVYPAPAFLKMKLTNYSGAFDEVGFFVNGQWIAAQPDGAAGEYSVQKTGLTISATPYTGRSQESSATPSCCKVLPCRETIII